MKKYLFSCFISEIPNFCYMRCSIWKCSMFCSSIYLRHWMKMQVCWLLKMVVTQRFQVWQRHATHIKVELPISSALSNCKQISTTFIYYMRSITVLDIVVLDNTNNLWSNMVIMCTCIVLDVASSCVLFTSFFMICKDLFIVKFLS